MFFGSVLIFSRIGTVLFGTFVYSFSNVLGSILTVTALLTGIYEDYPMPDSTIIHTIRIFVLFFSVFATGFITSYVSDIKIQEPYANHSICFNSICLSLLISQEGKITM